MRQKKYVIVLLTILNTIITLMLFKNSKVIKFELNLNKYE